MQLKFDPTKHFRATANPIVYSMPYFSQPPMPTHKRAEWWRPCSPDIR